jgi:hypothetical protein
MMNINPLTPEAIEILKNNPYVANVTEKTVRFTTEFKKAFWEKYRRGMAAPLILEQLGISPDLLGDSRVAGIRQHIKKQALRLNGFEDRRLNQPRPRKKPDQPDDWRLKRLEHELAYAQQELEFAKKIILADREAERK